jgi:hypothetical protein
MNDALIVLFFICPVNDPRHFSLIQLAAKHNGRHRGKRQVKVSEIIEKLAIYYHPAFSNSTSSEWKSKTLSCLVLCSKGISVPKLALEISKALSSAKKTRANCFFFAASLITANPRGEALSNSSTMRANRKHKN